MRSAERVYRKLVAGGTRDFTAEYNLGVSLREQDRLEEAVPHFRSAVELKPDFGDAHLDLGKTLWQLGRLEEAEQALRRAVSLKQPSETAWVALGGVLSGQGNLEGAAGALREGVRTAPASPEAHYTLGLVLRRQGKIEEAAREMALAAAHRRERESTEAAIVATSGGIRCLEKGDFEGGVRYFTGAVSRAPQFAPAYYQLSLALRKLGRPEQAAAALHTAETLDPGLRLSRSALGLRAWLQRQRSDR